MTEELANGTSGLEPLLKKSFLECKSCANVKPDLQILACLDSVCVDCMGEGTCCPICQQDLPKTQISAPDEFKRSLQSLAECMNRDLKSCDYCKFDGRSTDSQYRCIDCSDNMCDECADAHKRTKVTRDHMILTFKEISTNKYNDKMRLSQSINCKDHQNEPVNRYCATCSKLVCTLCRDSGPHETHNLQTIEKASATAKAGLDAAINKASANVSCLKDTAEFLSEYRESLKAQGEEVAGAIQERAQELHRMVDECRDEMLSKLETSIKDEIEQASQKNHEVQSLASSVQTSHFYLQALMEHAKPEEFLAVHKILQSRINQILALKMDAVPASQMNGGKQGANFVPGKPNPSTLNTMIGDLSLKPVSVQIPKLSALGVAPAAAPAAKGAATTSAKAPAKGKVNGSRS